MSTITLSSSRPELSPCVPVDFLWLPKQIRRALGVISLSIFCLLFVAVPLIILYTVLRFSLYRCSLSLFDGLIYGSTMLSLILPMREWPEARKIAQLWYELFDFSSNMRPDLLQEFIDKSSANDQYIIAMHPHGVIPLHAVLWAGYCDQYMTSRLTGKKLYGFGANADILMYLPFLRNVMGWLSGGSASYSVLKNGLVKGICPPVNAVGRIPRNLFILPGGIAEIFTSTPGKHVVVFNRRRGIVKLALETGAHILPSYVFGGTDFFHNLATSDSWISRLSRQYRIGITIFWGKYNLPIPFFPKVTLCVADPIIVKKWEGDGPVPSELIDEVHQKYALALKGLFDKYKTLAGYPNAELEII